MHFHHLLPILSLLTFLPIPSLTCNPYNIPSTPQFRIGTDCPADPATTGYTLNHFSLVVGNITATKHFYGAVLGMRHIFTFDASDAFSVTYMGFSHGGKNGTGFQTGQELFREKGNIEGLIEFVHFSGGPRPKPSTGFPNSFSHVGLVVPDVEKTQARMRQFGVRIVKEIGQAELPPRGPLANAYGLASASRAEVRMALVGIRSLGFDGFLIVEDPDGNLVEIQAQY